MCECVCVCGGCHCFEVGGQGEGRPRGWRGAWGGRREAGRPAGGAQTGSQAGGQTDGQDLCLSMCNTNVALDEMDSGPFFAATQRKKKVFFPKLAQPFVQVAGGGLNSNVCRRRLEFQIPDAGGPGPTVKPVGPAHQRSLLENIR